MASKFVLIVLACAFVTCNGEAPFRGYNNRVPQQQQQSAPYPAAGYRPNRTFNLPSDEAIAQQLRLAQIVKLQQQYQAQQQRQQQQQQQLLQQQQLQEQQQLLQQQQLQEQQQQQLLQQQQQQPSKLYGAPLESEASLPQEPSGLYGTPQEEQLPQQNTRPQRPSQVYGAPQEAAASQLQQQITRPQQPSRQYGAPQEAAASQRQIKFQRQQQLQASRQYGPVQEAPATQATPDSNSAESLEESKEVDTVTAVSNAVDIKPGRLTQGSEERDTENDEAETTKTTTATAQPTGFVLVPLTAAGYTPQKLAYFQAAPVATQFAKLQLPTVFGVQQPKLLAPQLLATQNYYQPQQFAYAAPLQAW